MDEKMTTIKILIPVWREVYVKTLLAYLLPSLMAPRNLPYLCKHCNVEIIFLTRKIDGAFLCSQPICRDIQKICKVTIISIDDLLVDDALYGYILTYAFMRGINSAVDMLSTYFVLLVADYVLSENALASLYEYIQNKYTVILSGSLRVIKESTQNDIEHSSYRQANILNIPSEDMVKIALSNLHPSLISKIVNQAYCFSSNYQHFYWLVDKDTIMAHYFMPHPLCFKPDRVVRDIPGFCDYTFIPTLCVEARTGYLDTSAKFIALELQNRTHELCFSRFGQRNIEEIAKGLSEWTTKEHRESSFQPFIFHAKTIPANINSILSQAKSFIDEIHKKLNAIPKSHLQHPHWFSNIGNFERLLKNNQGDGMFSLALGNTCSTLDKNFTKMVKEIIKKILICLNAYFLVPIWDQKWLDYKLIESALNVFFKCKNPLFISDNRETLKLYLSEHLLRKPKYITCDKFRNILIKYNLFLLRVYAKPTLKTLELYKDAIPLIIKYDNDIWMYGKGANAQPTLTKLNNQLFCRFTFNTYPDILLASEVPFEVYNEIANKRAHFNNFDVVRKCFSNDSLFDGLFFFLDEHEIGTFKQILYQLYPFLDKTIIIYVYMLRQASTHAMCLTKYIEEIFDRNFKVTTFKFIKEDDKNIWHILQKYKILHARSFIATALKNIRWSKRKQNPIFNGELVSSFLLTIELTNH